MSPRETYRHGDTRRALIEAGLELARVGGGPDAIVLREATRIVGVAPNSAYRHFADRSALVRAVSEAAIAQLAGVMEAEQATAHDLLRGVGRGYLRYARSEPGLFRTAFAVQHESVAPKAFQLLSAAPDERVAHGHLPSERRPGAEYLAWSAVHGLALLALDGPLRMVDDVEFAECTERLLDMVERGL